MTAARCVVVSAAVLAAVTGARAAEPPVGAAACSGCHPTSADVETPVARLAGRNAADIVTAMEGFRSGQTPATVMNRIAKGFSIEEIQAIAAWYAAQR
jgi:cytochrome c553